MTELSEMYDWLTVANLIKELPFDCNGHHNFLEKKYKSEYLLFTRDPDLQKIMIDKTEDQYITDLSCLNACPTCGEDTQLTITKNSAKITSPCEFPDGIPPCKVQIDVPSGKLVFGNDFRNYVTVKPDFYVNYDINIIKTSQAYADDGLFHGFTGNSCPGIFRIGDEIKIISPAYDEDEDEDEDEDVEVKGGERLGSICTDLWWFSAMDYDRYIANGGKVGDYETVVEVKPGRYEAEMFLEHRSWRKEEIFASIKRVENAD